MSTKAVEENPSRQPFAWEHVIGGLGLVLLIVGHYMGLFWSPKESWMGDTVRILYTHVPAAWVAMMTFTVSFVAALGYLFTGRKGLDWLVEATVEVGMAQGELQGCISNLQTLSSALLCSRVLLSWWGCPGSDALAHDRCRFRLIAPNCFT